jgi:acyl-CoA thioesterase
MDKRDSKTFPLRRFLGMDIDVVEPGHTLTRLHIDDTHLNPNGVVHGGVLFTMIDTAMGLATMTVLDEGRCASIEVHLRFLRPATSGVLEAHATVVSQGRKVVHLEARIHDDAGRLMATGTGTFAVVTT